MFIFMLWFVYVHNHALKEFWFGHGHVPPSIPNADFIKDRMKPHPLKFQFQCLSTRTLLYNLLDKEREAKVVFLYISKFYMICNKNLKLKVLSLKGLRTETVSLALCSCLSLPTLRFFLA